MMLRPPSAEQASALAIWDARKSQACSAAAGSGKTALLLHACARSAEPVLVLTYNKLLQTETSRALADCAPHATCRTFHGLCTEHLGPAPDDQALHEWIGAVRRGGIQPARLGFARVVVDEAQDVKDVFVALLGTLLDLESVQWLLVGDEAQMLYDFDEDDPANLDVLRTPWRFLGGAESDWARSRLSVSYRLSEPVAAVANAVRAPLRATRGGGAEHDVVPGNADSMLPVRFACCTAWEWLQTVRQYLQAVRAMSGALSDVAVLVPSTRDSSPPLRKLVNGLAAGGVSVRVGRPGGGPPGNSLTVSTYHAAKGAQFDFVVVIASDPRMSANALHVALTRARKHMLVVQDRRSPHMALLPADGLPAGLVQCDASWREWVRSRPDVCVPLEPRAPPLRRLNDAGRVAPRGRCIALSGEVVVPGGRGEPAPPLEPLALPESAYRCYEHAIRMMCEHAASGDCRMLTLMLAPPQHVPPEKLEAWLRAGRHDRALTVRASADELLPARARAALRRVAERGAAGWLDAGTCAVLWNSFHHAVDELLPSSGWGDPAEVAGGARRVREALMGEDGLVHDAVCARELDGQLVHCRCSAASAEAVCSVVFADELGREATLAACVPLAVHPTAERALLVNARTGEVVRLGLRCKDTFLRALLGDRR